MHVFTSQVWHLCNGTMTGADPRLRTGFGTVPNSVYIVWWEFVEQLSNCIHGMHLKGDSSEAVFSYIPLANAMYPRLVMDVDLPGCVAKAARLCGKGCQAV